MTQSDATEADPRPDFDPVLSMAVAGSWWDLGRRLAPFTGDAASAEQQTASLRDWAAAILKDEDDQDIIDAVTEDGLRTFVGTVLPLLERNTMHIASPTNNDGSLRIKSPPVSTTM